MAHRRVILRQIVERFAESEMQIGAVLATQSGVVDERCHTRDQRPIALPDLLAGDKAEIRDWAPRIQIDRPLETGNGLVEPAQAPEKIATATLSLAGSRIP